MRVRTSSPNAPPSTMVPLPLVSTVILPAQAEESRSHEGQSPWSMPTPGMYIKKK